MGVHFRALERSNSISVVNELKVTGAWKWPPFFFSERRSKF